MQFNKSLFLFSSFFLLCSLVSPTSQRVEYDEDVEDEDSGDTSNPLLDLASNFLQQGGGGGGGAGLSAIVGLVGNLMQQAGSSDKTGTGARRDRNTGAGDVLSSLGSLFSNKDGELDPNLIGSVISAFADSVGKNDETAEKRPKKRSTAEKPKKKKLSDKGEGLDLNTIMTMASAFMGNQNQKRNADEPNVMENIVGALPTILNMVNSFGGQEAKQRVHDHATHASFLPPMFEKMHLLWDHFSNSELGKTLWKNAGLKELTKTFADKKGNIDFELFLKSLENHSFRRKWIKKATNYLTDWAVHVANIDVQKRYLASSQLVINGFLKSQGFPNHISFQPDKLSESISNIVNYFLKNYIKSSTDVTVYVKSAVKYISDILSSIQAQGSFLKTADKNQISDKLTDTLNLEIIEPILKVYRTYRFAQRSPHCQTHLLCVINRHNPDEKLGLPGFKAGLTKISSFVASAALSYQGGHGFWDLYNAIQDDSNCQAKYPADCDDFHEEEVKVTTEYYHNEL